MHMTHARTMVAMVVFSVALMPIVSACGGGGGSCAKVQPCGGDVLGNWAISGACFNNAALNMDIGMSCPGASINITAFNLTGSARFNADLTYNTTGTATISLRETIPVSCLTAGSVALTCAELDQQLQEDIAANPGTTQTGHCEGSNICTCTVTNGPQTISETGTYATSGTTLTFTDSAGSISSNGYCVQGNELHIVQFDMTMPMGTIQADTVLTR